MPERRNPFAALAEPDDAAITAAARHRATAHKIAVLLSGGTADDDLLAGLPLFAAPTTTEATR